MALDSSLVCLRILAEWTRLGPVCLSASAAALDNQDGGPSFRSLGRRPDPDSSGMATGPNCLGCSRSCERQRTALLSGTGSRARFRLSQRKILPAFSKGPRACSREPEDGTNLEDDVTRRNEYWTLRLF